MPIKQGVRGWVIAVQRHKGMRFEKYYVVFAEREAAKSSMRRELNLPADAVLELRDKLMVSDIVSLRLRPGQIVKV
jgi:hypothetical protein